ncbi:hypothetical protein JX265_009968 [Neoarthrinium moseri]|uniref:Rhodopsin domain-containing protein n=1 Tax=Neoarthrinium moseri TaxID=1658444 RepID=A0A9Q0AMB5_9PEZI|nr:hypothetical protein JX265_009968 [Neoarthrinium moseri]
MTTQYGAGKHSIYITNARLIQILNIANEITYCFSMAFIKFSILSFYGTIFPSSHFHFWLWTVAAFVTSWAVSFSVVAVIQCMPIPYGWDPTITSGYCLDYGLATLIAGIFNIITDFTILCMPVPLVWKLHGNRHKKILLCLTFGMGGSACVVSLIRLAFTLKVGTTADGSWDIVPAGLLSVAELMSAILAACIPTYRPLFRKLVEGSTVGKKIAWSGYGSAAIRNDKISRDAPHTVNVSAGRFPNSTRPGINVTNQIELSVHRSKGGSWVRVPDED